MNNLKKSGTRKIKLTKATNFIYSKDKDKIDIKFIWNRQKVVSLSLIMFIYCIINVIK